MHDSLDIVITEQKTQLMQVRKISQYERPPFHMFPMAGYEIVKNQGVITLFTDELVDMASYISGSAGQKYVLSGFH
jgi:hypothetical protein